jgi:hypothetical protein
MKSHTQQAFLAGTAAQLSGSVEKRGGVHPAVGTDNLNPSSLLDGKEPAGIVVRRLDTQRLGKTGGEWDQLQRNG